MTERYRDFDIDEGYPGTYQYVHKDYDGPEDNRAGWARTVAECKDEIDEWHADHSPEARNRRMGCQIMLLTSIIVWGLIALFVWRLWVSPSAWEGGYKTCINEAGNAWVDCPKARKHG